MKKVSLISVLLLILSWLTLCLPASAEIISDGWWNAEETWTFDTETGTLTILRDAYNYGSFGWDMDIEEADVVKLVVEYGVTVSPAHEFADCKNLTQVELPGSITTIKMGAFSECNSLTHIRIPGSVTSIGEHVFFWCDSLRYIIFCGTQEQWNAIEKNDYYNEWNNYTITYHTPHTWDNGIITKQPSCTDGKKTYTCSECGEARAESIPKIAEHEYVRLEEYLPLQHKKICSCGDIQYETHVYDSDLDAYCNLCDYRRIVVSGVPSDSTNNGSQGTENKHQNSSNHDYNAWEMYSEMYHKKVCACGDSQFEDHVYSSEKDIDCNLCGFIKDYSDSSDAADETKEPANSDNQTEETEPQLQSSGCGAAVSMGAATMLLLSCGSLAVIFRRRKHH